MYDQCIENTLCNAMYYNVQQLLGVPVYKGLYEASRMPHNQHYDKATTKQVSTKYGLSSIKHEIMCNDEDKPTKV